MIADAIDSLVGVFSPAAQLRRMHARRVVRSFAGAEASRISAGSKPKNRSADSELMGPFGADELRAWSRKLVRDNCYAWGAVDTIVSSVVGLGIKAQSMAETEEGEDIEDVNDLRDAAWNEWCELCDINGQYTFDELQQIAQREMVEAGEVLIHLVKTPSRKYRGINRPVPLALEIIEADRLALEKDTYRVRDRDGNRIIRGVEIDELGKPVAYWIYPEHPQSAYATIRQTPERIPASDILHLFRRDRIGQTRGVSWFAPVLQTLRDLQIYIDNELQSSAVAACFAAAIKTTSPVTGLGLPTSETDAVDANSNTFEYLEPGLVARLKPGEDVVAINPTRPNSSSEPWINLMLRGIAVGTGLSFETVARDYSKTNYSSSRTSQLEDRRRFRRWQRYIVTHLCQPVWDRFCEQAAIAGVRGFPAIDDLLDNRRRAAPVDWQTPEWEWVDPQSEQSASDAALASFQSTYQYELGQRGKNWRSVFYQRAKEEKLKTQLGLFTADMANVAATQAEAQASAAAAMPGGQQSQPAAGAGEMSDSSRRQWQNNVKAIDDVLQALAAGAMSEAKARVLLGTLGLAPTSVDALIIDAADGTVDTPLQEAAADGA